jgi:hypothetical protein
MSMEEILAAARGKKAAGGVAAAPAPAAEEVAEEAEPEAQAPAEEVSATPTVASGGRKSLKDQITTVAEQIAYCRKVDKKK